MNYFIFFSSILLLASLFLILQVDFGEPKYLNEISNFCLRALLSAYLIAGIPIIYHKWSKEQNVIKQYKIGSHSFLINWINIQRLHENNNVSEIYESFKRDSSILDIPEIFFNTELRQHLSNYRMNQLIKYIYFLNDFKKGMEKSLDESKDKHYVEKMSPIQSSILDNTTEISMAYLSLISNYKMFKFYEVVAPVGLWEKIDFFIYKLKRKLFTVQTLENYKKDTTLRLLKELKIVYSRI